MARGRVVDFQNIDPFKVPRFPQIGVATLALIDDTELDWGPLSFPNVERIFDEAVAVELTVDDAFRTKRACAAARRQAGLAIAIRAGERSSAAWVELIRRRVGPIEMRECR
jgi:hypothetical protein